MSGNSSAAAGKAKNKKTVPKEEKRKKMLVNLKKPRKQGWFKPGTDDEAGSVVSSVAGSESRIPTSRPPEIIGNMPPPEVNTENVVRKFPRRPSFLGLFSKPDTDGAASVVSSAGSESRIPTSHPPEIIENMPPLEVNTENVVRKFPRRPSFLQSPSQQDVDVSDSPKPVRSAKKDRPTHTKVGVKDSTRSRPPRPQSIRSPSPRPPSVRSRSPRSSTVRSRSRSASPRRPSFRSRSASPRPPSFRDRRSSSNGRSSQCAQDLVSDKDRPLYTQPNSMTEVTKKRALKEKVVSVKDHDVYTRSASMTEATERRALREKAFLSCAEKMTTTWKEEREEDALGDDIEQQEVSQVLQECD